jgi:broad-specificity NMP kinase
LAASLGLTHLSINTIVKDKGCHDGWDEEYQSWIVDEDKVLGFVLFSYHGTDIRNEANMSVTSCWTRLRRKSRVEVTLSIGMHVIYFLRAGLIWWWY